MTAIFTSSFVLFNLFIVYNSYIIYAIIYCVVKYFNMLHTRNTLTQTKLLSHLLICCFVSEHNLGLLAMFNLSLIKYHPNVINVIKHRLLHLLSFRS